MLPFASQSSPPPPSLDSRPNQSDRLNWCFTAVTHLPKQSEDKNARLHIALPLPCHPLHFTHVWGEQVLPRSLCLSPSHPPPAGKGERGIGLTAPGVRLVIKPSQLAPALEDDQGSLYDQLLLISFFLINTHIQNLLFFHRSYGNAQCAFNMRIFYQVQ